jgi:spermidine synthase
VKLGDEFLMSSLFTASETELARVGLGSVHGPSLDVVVGGLGLGYTAQAVLADRRVRSMHVVEALGEVIEWHRRGLVPLGPELTADPRTTFVHDDFFALVAADGVGPHAPEPCHAVLVDIDHSPRHVLHPRHARFYSAAGLARLADRLHAGGVFALWSDDTPDEAFIAVVEAVFGSCRAEVVSFQNPLTGGTGTSTVYVAVR